MPIDYSFPTTPKPEMALFVIDKQRLSAVEITNVWNTLTKCKDQFENGHRLEYLFWRIWGKKGLNANRVIESIYDTRKESLNLNSINVKNRVVAQRECALLPTKDVVPEVKEESAVKSETKIIPTSQFSDSDNSSCFSTQSETTNSNSITNQKSIEQRQLDSAKMETIQNDYKELAKSLNRERSRLEADKYFHHKASPDKHTRITATVDKLDDLKVYKQPKVESSSPKGKKVGFQSSPHQQNNLSFEVEKDRDFDVYTAKSQSPVNGSGSGSRKKHINLMHGPRKQSALGSPNTAKPPNPHSSPSKLRHAQKQSPVSVQKVEKNQPNIQFYIADESDYSTSYDSDISDFGPEDGHEADANRAPSPEEKDKKFQKSRLLPSHKRPSLLSVAIQRNHFNGKKVSSEEGEVAKDISASLKQVLTIDHHMCINRSKSELDAGIGVVYDVDYW